LLEQGRATTDVRQRKLIYSQAQRILAEDLPYIPFWWKKNVVVQPPGLRGFLPYPDGDLTSLKRVAFSSSSPAS
jgi:peptide/nickel transport system substrate-binding protein